jgi:hypothetical protein
VASLGDLLLDADPVPGELKAVTAEPDELGEPERRVRECRASAHDSLILDTRPLWATLGA